MGKKWANVGGQDHRPQLNPGGFRVLIGVGVALGVTQSLSFFLF